MKRLFRKLTARVLAAVMLFVLLPVSFSMRKAGAEWAPDREWEWTRFRGANRYETSAEIMRWELGQKKNAPFQPQVKMSPEGMGIATGLGFADALGAVSLLGETLSPHGKRKTHSAFWNSSALEKRISGFIAVALPTIFRTR